MEKEIELILKKYNCELSLLAYTHKDGIDVVMDQLISDEVIARVVQSMLQVSSETEQKTKWN